MTTWARRKSRAKSEKPHKIWTFTDGRQRKELV